MRRRTDGTTVEVLTPSFGPHVTEMVVAAPSIADAIAIGKQDLIRCWRARVQAGLDPAAAPAPEIMDTLPSFIDEMVAMLRQPHSVERPAEMADQIAFTHGSQRFHAGFSLGTVIREYGILRQCLIQLIRDRGVAYTLDELDGIGALLNTAVANAAEQFARERDEAIERESQRHFGFIAHELRNPLGSAVLAAHLLQQRPGAEGDVVLQRLNRNLSTLSQRIDKSLVGLRVRHVGRTRSVELAEVSLLKIVEAVRDDLAGDAEDRRISILVDGAAVARADQRLIQSAVANLVGNAVKFSRAGGTIRIRVREAPTVASVEIEDECGGLPAGKTEELFTPFTQRGADRSGFGLGLAIVKDAVEAHHGSVQATNLPGKGCVFMISLPRSAPFLSSPAR